MKTTRRLTWILIAVLLLAITASIAVAAAVNPPPSGISFTLQGCRLPVNNQTGLPLYTLPLNGKFICNNQTWTGGNDDYTTGNLGKSWNELDLVPYRIVVDAGNSAPASSSFTFAAVLDAFDAGHPGYDVISAPTLNPGSSAGCPAPIVGPQTTAIPGLGGIDQSIYRRIDLNGIQKGTTCVYDYYGRLALGSHLFPGSSLHGNLALLDPAAPGGITTSGIGSRDVSIPVKEISPQELRKDMSATQGSDHVWNIFKDATPAELSFGNTCDVSQPLSAGVQITVRWEKLAANPSGPATVITHVYAKNPASRVITVNVTDKIYEGNTQTNLLDTANSGDVDVPANTEALVLTHTFVWNNPTSTTLNDIATATYIDKITGIPVPGNTTATASATVQNTGPELNASAIINDVESITGSGLSYSVDSFSGASGSFDGGYVAGTKTTGSVSWTSDSQTGNGSVTFDKTIYADKGTIEPNGNLHDVATLTGSNGFTTSASADVTISVDTKASLTINKTIPNILQGSETATFNFTVKDAGNNTVATASISFAAGETSKSTSIGNLTPGVYTVSEGTTPGFNPQNPVTVDLSGAICSGAASFTNTAVPAAAKVKKVTAPAGFEANWEFKLYQGNTLLETVTTSGAGFVNFSTQLGEGSYSIVETSQPGWSSDGGVGCSFTVNLPGDAGNTFACTFTNTYQPSVSLAKNGDTLSKIGDKVHYSFDATNTSPSGGAAGVPNLVCTITDSTIGYSSGPQTLAAGGTFSSGPVEFTIPSGAADPFPNTASVSCTYPSSATAVASNTASHSINLFQPSITFDKTGDTLSKVGDSVNYVLTLTNTSSSDTPDLVCTITDAKIGVNKSVTLASGTSDVTNKAYTVQAGDSDPLLNTASVSCSPTGFPNVLTASDGHSVNLFQPSVKITKTGPAYSKAGDTATFNVTIENTSSADSPDLKLDSFSDSLVSGVTPPASCNTLASGASCSFSYTYTVKAGDPDPLVNTATAHYHPDGFPNDITNSSSWTTDLLHPSFTVTKACKTNTEPISQAGPAIFTITFNNTGDADLHVVPSEGAAFDVAAGGSTSYDYSINGPFSATVSNTVTGGVTLASKYALSNSYTFLASGSCIVEGKAKVIKTVNGQPPAAGQTFTFELRQGASTSSDGTTLETKTTDASGNINFTTSLVPGQQYQICEWVMPGWNTNLTGDGPLFVPNSIIPPSLPNPNVNNMTVCANFTVTSGQTRTFTVDNTPPPGGRALTIGFWKNWASCANSSGKGQKPMTDLALAYASQNTTNPPGGLVVSAQNAGSGWPNYASLWYLVLKGDPTSTKDSIKPAPDCAKAVNLLNKTTIDGKTKKSSDPLFNMTAQLVAAQLNRFMGAGISGVTITNIDKAVLLNGKYGFNGLTYSPKLTSADSSLANCLATQLDNYNNDRPVSSCP